MGAGVLAAPKLMTRYSTVPENGDGVSFRNAGKPSLPDAAVWPRKFH